jgi:monoamine oxidase
MSQQDVVIVGAGAAGVGASMLLERAGVPHVVLEAQDRVGGRAFTDAINGVPFDAGCHWFHSADKNPLRIIADRLGHGYRKPHEWPSRPAFVDGRWIGPEERDRFDTHIWSTFDIMAEAGRIAPDRPASAVVDLSPPYGRTRRHWIELMTSASPDNASVADYAAYDDTGVNLAVRDGYGALIAKLARNLRIHLSSPVERIETKTDGVRVSGPFGAVEAKVAIVTVPVAVLSSGAIAFAPALDSTLLAALDGVPMGHYEKAVIAFDRLCLDIPDTDELPYCSILSPSNPNDRPINVQVHPFGRPIAVSDLAGDTIREVLADGGPKGFTAFIVDRLAEAFGGGVRQRVTATTATGWAANPFIRGAYSCAKPGRAGDRARLVEGTVTERVFLAGEASSAHAMSTAHGAFLSGIAQARRASRLTGGADVEPAALWS